ncbi:hypothetical protein AN958_03522 [Leucoagaricus sp. SymC.cos]|nr:hypothetical protein AN958_03522 [Leucoagaricus sp. SymC.cos]
MFKEGPKQTMAETDISDHRLSLETAVGDYNSGKVHPTLPAVAEATAIQESRTPRSPTHAELVTSLPIPVSPSTSYQSEWSQLHVRIGHALRAEDETVGLGQACLALLTAPFMVVHGVFKMTGAILISLGLIFVVLGKLAKRLAYKPKKKADLVLQYGPSQV